KLLKVENAMVKLTCSSGKEERRGVIATDIFGVVFIHRWIFLIDGYVSTHAFHPHSIDKIQKVEAVFPGDSFRFDDHNISE
ncbi:hypothetical protein SK128_000495, partial [Halocaridina rubra]